MTHKITRDDEVEIYSDYLRGERQQKIAEKFGISQGHVSSIIKRVTIRNDEKLAVSTALDFIAAYTREGDYIEMKKRELEAILQSTDDDKLKAKIIMDQVALSQTILHHVKQGKFMQAIQEDANALAAFMHTVNKPKPELEE